MISPAACLLALLLIALAPDGLPASGTSWDWLGGMGLAALAFLIALSWEAEAPAPQPRLSVHRNLAIGASLLTLIHALGYLITDPITLQYLKPKAPAHMLFGILGGLMLLALTITALPSLRPRFYKRFAVFRRWHIGLSVATIIAALWHVVGTGYLITSWWQITAMLALCLLVPVIAYGSRRRGLATTIGQSPETVNAANRTALLALLITGLLATVYAVVKNP